MNKQKSIISKLLFSLLIVVALMIIKSNKVSAFDTLMGGMDFHTGPTAGDGITIGPHMYNYGDQWCVDNTKTLARTDTGSKGGTCIAYVNRNKNDYSYRNEMNHYALSNSAQVEQSIAAAYYTYKLMGQGSKTEMQQNVWSSGQWKGKEGYHNNLVNYTGNKQSAGSKAISARAQQWANFYYNVLKPSGMKVNIDVKPTDEKELSVYVDQIARTYTQGPYMIDLKNSGGASIAKQKTEYSNGEDLGTLIYNEIIEENPGEEYFKFCELDEVYATVKYTDGSIQEKVKIKILDENGQELKFPKFTEIFYIQIQIPAGETRTVETFEMDFKLKYITELPGKVNTYKSDWIEYELTCEQLKELTTSILFYDAGRESSWKTMESISTIGVENEGQLRAYLLAKIVEAARIKGYNIVAVDVVKTSGFKAHFYATPGGHEAKEYTSTTTFKNDTISYYKSKVNEVDRGYWKDITDEFGDVVDREWVSVPKWEYNGTDYDSKGDAESKATADAEEYVKKILDVTPWFYYWMDHNPALKEEGTQNVIQPGIEIILQSLSADTYSWAKNDKTEFHLIGTDCTVEIGGKVWEDIGQTKENTLNGKIDGGDKMYGGMLVELHLGDANGPVVPNLGAYTYSTTTDANGLYHFYKLNALEKYTVVFTFNGQLYQQTFYNDNLSGGFSNAKEIDRAGFDDRFDRIDSSPNNYNHTGWNQGYGKNVYLKDSSGNNTSVTFRNAWDQFVQAAIGTKNYEGAYGSLSGWLSGNGVSGEEINRVIHYIKDCMILANTRKYPVYDSFVIENLESPGSQPQTEVAVGKTWPSLYTALSDQSRNVDFGINERDSADLALQKDLFKTTVRVNGKTQTYMYNKKDSDIDDDGNWNITVRAGDYLYNGDYKYTREIRKSEYLYEGDIYTAGGTNAKDLRVYVTYRIAIRNQSQTCDTSINEIVDYYDKNEFTFDGVKNGNNYTPNSYSDFEHSNVTSYVGDRNGNKVKDLTVTENSTLGNGVGNKDLGHGYTPIYLSGITKPNGGTYLSTGDIAFVYVTFEVNKHTDENGMEDRVQLDQNVMSGALKGTGKRNIAEINGYSTIYKSGYVVPDRGDVGGQKAGLLDIDSRAGNLTGHDLDGAGDLIISNDPVKSRVEDDTDKAPNVILKFPATDDDERVVQGYVYEDSRNTKSDEAVVGNGVYEQGETLIDGVTVQLVELVQEVNGNGIPTGKYLGEYVWNSKRWDAGSKSWVDVNSSANSGSLRYYSGQGQFATDATVSPIISGVPGTATEISGYKFEGDPKGQYAFKSIPAGDLFVRFIYGDTTQTTLTKTDGEGSEVTNLLNGANVDNTKGYISTSGLNAKSYNGQDYKSTTYQTGVNQDGSYNGINGFKNYDVQNYSILGEYKKDEVNTTDGKDKNVMYYYNIGNSQNANGVSDAKDVKNIRDNEKLYSSGEKDIDGVTNASLTNARAEVLASGLKIASNDLDKQEGISKETLKTSKVSKQIELLKELMTNTKMIAQTGVINTTVEWNTAHTDGQGDNNNMNYVLKDVDLGLEERPVAQLRLSKEVSNLKITLADGTIMFDTDKSVNNLPFSKHEGHKVTYSDEQNKNINVPTANAKAYRLTAVKIANNTASMPELITTYMDEELMYGARIELMYTLKVTNVGEVDYIDNRFYYTGKSAHAGDTNYISKTNPHTIVDYISNNLQFLPTNSANKDGNGNTIWAIRTVDELTGHGTENKNSNKDLVNSKYKKVMETYNSMVTTKSLSKDLLPEGTTEKDESTVSTKLMLSSTLVPDTGDDSMVYNNLAEVVQTSNTQGRRMKYAISGNQPMSDQTLKPQTSVDEENGVYTKADLVTPTEIDADSAQKVLILPPTGANRNYTVWIIVGIMSALIIVIGAVLIKKYFRKK